MFDTEFFYGLVGISSWGEGSSKNIKELWIKTSDSHIDNAKIRSENTWDWVFCWFDDNVVDSFDFYLSLLSKSACLIGRFLLVLVSSLDPICLGSFSREKELFSVEVIQEILGLVRIEIESEFFPDSLREIPFTNLNSFAHQLFRFYQFDLKFQVGQSSLLLIWDFVGLYENQVRCFIKTEVFSDVETHADFSFLDVFVKTAFEDFAIDHYVDDSGGVFSQLCWDVDRVFYGEFVS